MALCRLAQPTERPERSQPQAGDPGAIVSTVADSPDPAVWVALDHTDCEGGYVTAVAQTAELAKVLCERDHAELRSDEPPLTWEENRDGSLFARHGEVHEYLVKRWPVIGSTAAGS